MNPLNPHLFPISVTFFLIIILSQIPTFLCVENEQYANCSKVFQCAGIPDLGYPFWGGSRPDYCGHLSFGLNCTGDAPLITIQTRPYRVLTINNSTQILKVVREEFWENICPTEFVNATVDNTPFTYVSSQDLMLYYGCARLPTTIPGQFDCSVDGTTNTLGFPSFVPNMTLVTSCHIGVSVRVDQTEATAFASNPTSVTVTQVLDSGVELQWDANNSICDRCIGSGGKCGSNTSSGLFACYCSDKPYAFTCNTTQNGTGSSSTNRFNLGIKLTIAFSIIVAVTCLITIIFCLKRWFTSSANAVDDQNVEAFIRNYGSLAPKRCRYSDLKKITSSFKYKLGQGGYGSVYKGKLSDGRLVAVKVLSQTEGNGQEFINEVASISRTSHVNVVNLLGFCFETKRRALIYEFMANGSLDKFICNDESVNTNCRLEWSTLYQIAVGIARGLEYLHRGCSTRIVHFDIKPHNILLDEDLRPKISDFGLAKLCHTKWSHLSIVGVRGTAGYTAPEVFSRTFGQVSHKSDVYSYGMMVLEMTGARDQKVVVVQTSEKYFPHWIYEHLEHGKDLSLHGVITTTEEEETVRKMILVGLWCIQTNPSDRPPMSKVVEMLEGSLQSLQIPPKPYLFPPTRANPSTQDTSNSLWTMNMVEETPEDGLQYEEE
ncbi:unnamed protein product [Camellia sinensis]